MKININKVKAKHYSEACCCCKSKQRAKEVLNAAMAKARNNCPMKDAQDKLFLLFSVIRDWIRGYYEVIPLGSLIVIFVALLYFISPIDIVPDFLPAGLIDDAFIISLVTKQISSDLEKYKRWKAAVSSPS